MPSNSISVSIIKGNVCIDAHNGSKEKILKNINKLLKSPEEGNIFLIEGLWNNYIGQVIIGNEAASLG